MSNERQIPNLRWRPSARHGYNIARWSPSPAARKAGWKGRDIGNDSTPRERIAAIGIALELNDKLRASRSGGGVDGLVARRPDRLTFGDLVTRYQQSSEYLMLKPASQREYRSRLRFLESWARDGALPIVQLDKDMVRDLRSVLLAPGADGAEASLHRCSAMLRVLRLLMNWAVANGYLERNPTEKMRAPTPPSRLTILTSDEVDACEAAAQASEWPALALALPLAYWTLQRESDLLALNRIAWRPIEAVNPEDAAVLANPAGVVMGFRLRQKKTGAWVEMPLPPSLHGAIEAAFARSQWLLPDDANLARPCPAHLFQRRMRKIFDKAGQADAQFRDLRRSGMVRYGDMGIEGIGITAISGHMILGRRTIMDTYMPKNTRSACAAVAQAVRHLAARAARLNGQATA